MLWLWGWRLIQALFPPTCVWESREKAFVSVLREKALMRVVKDPPKMVRLTIVARQGTLGELLVVALILLCRGGGDMWNSHFLALWQFDNFDARPRPGRRALTFASMCKQSRDPNSTQIRKPTFMVTLPFLTLRNPVPMSLTSFSI